MPLGDSISTGRGMLDDLKSRLGFSRNEDQYDDYDDYDDQYDDYEDDYDEYDDFDDRAESGAYRPASVSSGRYRRGDSSPNLVSIDDVKAHTQVPDTLLRDPLASDSRSYSSRNFGRDLVENTGPAESSPAYNAAKRERERAASHSRSEGLDALFEPSTGSRSYDPYEAYSSTSPSTYTTTRSITVIKPVAYGDVERVARALKAGDIVVLGMRNTPDDLSKRVLDFSFGVASALDANVECPASKVFAIARGQALTEDEKRSLRLQGVL